jgi:hypothetical protein
MTADILFWRGAVFATGLSRMIAMDMILSGITNPAFKP